MKKVQPTAPSLKVTYRRGRALAAYLTLPAAGERRAKTSKPFDKGVVADLDENGRCIGLELLAPESISLDEINEILKSLGGDELGPDELWPLARSRSVA